MTDREWSDTHPLVTFALFSYNQEKYIKEAVEGALSQSYEPLEVILSDDCSTDRTFDIITELVSNYHGPHQVKLNQNLVNRGISRHVDMIDRMAKGSIIVHAAGDDISLPERTQTIVDAYLSEKDRPSLIESNAILINDKGEVIGRYIKNNKYLRKRTTDPTMKNTIGGGCSYAIHRSVVHRFNEPDPRISTEDRIINTRSNLLNGTLYIPEPLLKYRILETGAWNVMNKGDISWESINKFEIECTQQRIFTCEQVLQDIKHLALHDTNKLALQQSFSAKTEASLQELLKWQMLISGTRIQSLMALAWACIYRKNIKLSRWLKALGIRWLSDCNSRSRKCAK